MADALVWWLWVELLGIIALPVTFYLFRYLPDRGYAFSKPLALLFLGYTAWMAASLHLLPNARGSSILILFLLGFGCLVLLRIRQREIIDFISTHRASIIATELLFTGAFILWAVVRAHNPEIRTTEQPMDFAFLNGVLRSHFFPPNDPWLSGQPISYYYFGYLMVAQLVSLSGVASSVGYNLALAMFFALTAAGAFSLVFNLVAAHSKSNSTRKAISYGFVAAVLIVGVGNLEGVLEVLNAHGFNPAGFWQWISIKDLGKSYLSTQWYPNDGWWWWRSTRVIDTVVDGKSLDYTITEFPFFSFLLGDMHPHVMSLPFVLTSIGLALNVFRAPVAVSISWLKRRPLEFLALAIIFGGLSFINSWDFPSFTLLFLCAALLRKYLLEDKIDRRFWREWVTFGGLLVFLAVVLYVPFYLTLKTQASGILPVLNISTRPLHYFIIWGGFIVLYGSFLIGKVWQVARGRDFTRSDLVIALLALVPLAAWILLSIGIGVITGQMLTRVQDIGQKIVNIWPWLLICFLALFLVINRVRAAKRGDAELGGSEVFAVLLIFAGVMLTIGPDFFYIRDTFGSRMNTVFKFYYQAWALLAISSGFGLYYIIRRWRPVAFFGWWVVATLLLGASLVYPVTSVFAKTGGFSQPATLDGLAFVKASTPAEYEAIQWLANKADGSSVVVEATGGEYSQFARVSTYSGMPTLLGWAGHEIQWRGSSKPFEGRAEDIDKIYQGDAGTVSALLKKYNVSYVYFGNLEKGKYQGADQRLSGIMDVAFKNDGVTIFQARKG